MLELKQIRKDYQIGEETTTVLKGIDLSFPQNEFVAILGPSGCGKTTLLNIIGGLDHATSGDLLINGKSTKDYSDKEWDTYRHNSIGFVFQSYNLIPHQSILSNVALALTIGGVNKKEATQKAKEALIKVGLEKHLRKKPNQLSGGQCQRVSIARALVANPDVILADEPTGALDSETSLQVMDALKNVSKERLVIMVTHNQDLAKRYADRIIRMVDGKIVGDETNAAAPKTFERGNEETGKTKQAKMSLRSVFGLSASNLLEKKSKTFITAFASSIGIIGISVVLSVSNGMNAYVQTVETDSSSSNYILISSSKTSLFPTAGTGGASASTDSGAVEYPADETGVYPYEPANATVKKQILSSDYVNYLNTNILKDGGSSSLALGISYTRNVSFNLISESSTGYSLASSKSWYEFLDNPDYMANQYEVLYDGKDNTTMPKAFNEIALVVDSYNRLSTTVLKELGIAYDDGLDKIPYSELIGKTYTLVPNDGFYLATSYGDKAVYRAPNTQDELAQSALSGIPLTIVSLIREKKDASASWVSPGIAFLKSLTDHVVADNQDSAVVKAQKANPTYDVLTGSDFVASSGGGSIFGGSSSVPTYDSVMLALGADTAPSSIYVYPKDFASKDKIVQLLDEWNSSEIYKLYGNEKDTDGNYVASQYEVAYTDISSLISGMLGNVISIISSVLIAFSAVSLIVSSIMIAVIIYASVIERIKEIGILRSLGARKKDVSLVFESEAGIIGLVSSLIALLATLGINGIINLVLNRLVGVSTIASLSWVTVLVMFVLGVGLNVVASLVPAKIAAKKDPVVALRTE
jgi:putative ABC transport system permease protein